jgi:hypothetical protein
VGAGVVNGLEAGAGFKIGPAAPLKSYPKAALVAQLATGRLDFVPGERLQPIYLRETSFIKAAPTRQL